MRSLTAVLLLLLALTACGGDTGDDEPVDGESAEASGGADDAPVLYDNSEIIEHIGFEDTGSGFAETELEGGETCEVLILTGAESLALYADAGDVVASNPDGTVGGKIISTAERSCFELVTERLSDFPPS